MTEVDIVNALNPLVSNRVYPDVADFETPRPYIVYQQVGGQSVNFLEPSSSQLKNARIQITVWSDTRLQAMSLIRHVEDIMRAPPIAAFVQGAAIAHYDNSTELRGAMQDFSVWIS